MQPALSMGNAGQLAVDLLISHGACKAGYLEEPHVLPCVGNDPFGPSADGDLAVALEGMSVKCVFGILGLYIV